MRTRITLFLLLLITFSVDLVQAQDAQTWYWAVTDTGALVAYTADGQVNTLAESGVGIEDFDGWRFGADEAMVSFYINGVPSLYQLTPTSIRSFAWSYNGDQLFVKKWLPLAQNDTYVVILTANANGILNSPLLVNLKTHSFVYLTGNSSASTAPYGHPTFSADGHYLRYATQTDKASKTVVIREYELETGQERVIYETPALAILTADHYGENWVYSDSKQTIFIESSGKVRIQDESDRTARIIFNDDLVSYNPVCQAACSIMWQPHDGAATLTFKMVESSLISGLAAPDDTHLLVLTGLSFWLLGADGSATKVGDWSPGRILTPQSSVVSPDGRWVLALTQNANDPAANTQYGVWDNTAQTYIMENAPDRDVHGVQVFYGAVGFIIGEDNKHYRLYRTSDNATIELPDIENVTYYAVLDDDKVLCIFNQATDKGDKGIYSYVPATDSFNLLVPDAVPLYIEIPQL